MSAVSKFEVSAKICFSLFLLKLKHDWLFEHIVSIDIKEVELQNILISKKY